MKKRHMKKQKPGLKVIQSPHPMHFQHFHGHPATPKNDTYRLGQRFAGCLCDRYQQGAHQLTMQFLMPCPPSHLAPDGKFMGNSHGTWDCHLKSEVPQTQSKSSHVPLITWWIWSMHMFIESPENGPLCGWSILNQLVNGWFSSLQMIGYSLE